MKKIRAPYIVIILLCLLIATIRYTLIVEWPWYMHILAFIIQSGLLIGMWTFPPLVDLGVLVLFATVAIAVATWSFQQQD